MKPYAALAFTDPIKKLQERYGSRSAYARQENHTYRDGLSGQEAAFIAEQDSPVWAKTGFRTSSTGAARRGL
ncbi:hypothetical protein [Larkinella knui]|uniref:hypothetical protein n=1 Tax=Larkinella knui TaxID=2025310 RepID=UPI001E405828|nr:hypothetical protein [Larkinella knui]